MLVLTRRIGESLKIGADIHVVVLGTKGNQVQIGIGAPKTIKVLRDELISPVNEQPNVQLPPPATD